MREDAGGVLACQVAVHEGAIGRPVHVVDYSNDRSIETAAPNSALATRPMATMTSECTGTTVGEGAPWRAGLGWSSGRAFCLGSASLLLFGEAAVVLSTPTALGKVDELGAARGSPDDSTGAEETAAAGRVVVSGTRAERTPPRAARPLLLGPRRPFVLAFVGVGERRSFTEGLGSAGGRKAPSPGALAPAGGGGTLLCLSAGFRSTVAACLAEPDLNARSAKIARYSAGVGGHSSGMLEASGRPGLSRCVTTSLGRETIKSRRNCSNRRHIGHVPSLSRASS